VATFIERATDIITGAVDVTPSNPQLLRLANAALKKWPELLEAVDPLNPTNEEKARVFVLATKAWGKKWLAEMAEQDTRATAETDVITARTTAEADF
jgi:hypothetical protein